MIEVYVKPATAITVSVVETVLRAGDYPYYEGAYEYKAPLEGDLTIPAKNTVALDDFTVNKVPVTELPYKSGSQLIIG